MLNYANRQKAQKFWHSRDTFSTMHSVWDLHLGSETLESCELFLPSVLGKMQWNDPLGYISKLETQCVITQVSALWCCNVAVKFANCPVKCRIVLQLETKRLVPHWTDTKRTLFCDFFWESIQCESILEKYYTLHVFSPTYMNFIWVFAFYFLLSHNSQKVT